MLEQLSQTQLECKHTFRRIKKCVAFNMQGQQIAAELLVCTICSAPTLVSPQEAVKLLHEHMEADFEDEFMEWN